ncbi:MAG: aminoacetone oxidase family FAD-binding enzyme [Kiritimatiellaeota bacterium]|nr:aminoacetone oxidase family FAD-binding enzyme [Kiritimatiellota bacterium]
MPETLIIGGGAAGLMAACFAPRRAVVIERLASPGRKLLATGGGRCNLTHATDAGGIAAAFGLGARFTLPALHAFPPQAIRAFFRAQGVETRAQGDGCVFPVSQKATDVLDALQHAARANGAEFRCGTRVKRLVLEHDAQRIAAVETSAGTLTPHRVILAAGGQSYPELGSDGSGFTLARQAGLEVVRPVPALAGLVVAEAWVPALTGILCEHGSVRLEGKPIEGPVLFTHKGISGPPALALSGEVSARLQSAPGVTVRVSFRAGRSPQDWLAQFAAWRQAHGGRRMHNLLSGELPRALAVALCAQAGLADAAVAGAGKKALQTLAALCGDCALQVTGTEGWGRAMLTRGGVALHEIDSKTLVCKRIRNLHCAGEVIDLDAPCGGFNLTWAFASARLAATSAC